MHKRTIGAGLLFILAMAVACSALLLRTGGALEVIRAGVFYEF